MDTKQRSINITEEYLFILFKPDALKREDILYNIVEKIRESELKIVDIFWTCIDQKDIYYVWPQSTNNFVFRNLLFCYLAYEKLLVVVLEGEAVIKKCGKIKKNIRQKYAICRFSNCIHTPDDIEIDKQLELFKNKEIYIWNSELLKNKNIEKKLFMKLVRRFEICKYQS